MKVTRFYTTPDGGSRFEEIAVSFSQSRDDDFGNTLRLSRPIEALDAAVVELPDGLDQGWHNAPQRQAVFVLRGTVEVETTDGERRRWGAGDVFIADDVDGKGHLTRVHDGPAHLLFVHLADAVNLANWSS